MNVQSKIDTPGNQQAHRIDLSKKISLKPFKVSHNAKKFTPQLNKTEEISSFVSDMIKKNFQTIKERKKANRKIQANTKFINPSKNAPKQNPRPPPSNLESSSNFLPSDFKYMNDSEIPSHFFIGPPKTTEKNNNNFNLNNNNFMNNNNLINNNFSQPSGEDINTTVNPNINQGQIANTQNEQLQVPINPNEVKPFEAQGSESTQNMMSQESLEKEDDYYINAGYYDWANTEGYVNWNQVLSTLSSNLQLMVGQLNDSIDTEHYCPYRNLCADPGKLIDIIRGKIQSTEEMNMARGMSPPTAWGQMINDIGCIFNAKENPVTDRTARIFVIVTYLMHVVETLVIGYKNIVEANKRMALAMDLMGKDLIFFRTAAEERFSELETIVNRWRKEEGTFDEEKQKQFEEKQKLKAQRKQDRIKYYKENNLWIEDSAWKNLHPARKAFYRFHFTDKHQNLTKNQWNALNWSERNLFIQKKEAFRRTREQEINEIAKTDKETAQKLMNQFNFFASRYIDRGIVYNIDGRQYFRKSRYKRTYPRY